MRKKIFQKDSFFSFSKIPLTFYPKLGFGFYKHFSRYWLTGRRGFFWHQKKLVSPLTYRTGEDFEDFFMSRYILYYNN